MKAIDEEEIIGRVLRGDRQAFAYLVDAYKGPVFNLAFRMTGSVRDADDLAQEIFFRAFRSLGRFKQGARFFPWLYTLGLNVIRNHLRKVNTLPEIARNGLPEASDPRGDPSDAAIGGEISRRLQNYLLRLPLAVREALILRFYEGMNFEDIASVTGGSLSSTKMKVYRGLEKIRAMMEEEGFPDDEPG